MGRREEKRSCCTWPRILALVVLLIAGAICVWYFVPWDYTINKVLDDVDIPFGNSDESTDDGVPPLKDNDAIPNTIKPQPVVTPSPTLSPTKPPDYDFMRCNSENAGECCNGQEGICDLRLNEALFATLHNGMATFEDGFLFGPNHKYKLEGALDRGYRGLNLDICNCGGEIMFCHGEYLRLNFQLPKVLCEYNTLEYNRKLIPCSLFSQEYVPSDQEMLWMLWKASIHFSTRTQRR